MRQTISTLLAVLTTQLVTALPANRTIVLQARSLDGSINWFTRDDCQNPCIEIGMCLMGQTNKGMTPYSENDWIGWDSGCWDRPDGANSIALSVSNGHKFTGIGKTCKEWKDDGFEAQSWDLKSGDQYGDDKCNYIRHQHIQAVFYHW